MDIHCNSLNLLWRFMEFSGCKVLRESLALQGLDIGPDSLKTFQDALGDAKTVIWNGPMGVFEFPAFAKGTYGVADTLAELTPKVAFSNSLLPSPRSA